MKNAYKVISIFIATSVVTFSACQRKTDNDVHFGAILSLTGAAAPYGQDNLRGLQLAEEVLNERGGVRGKKVVVDVQDSTGDPAQAVTLAQRFASDQNVVGILGPTR